MAKRLPLWFIYHPDQFDEDWDNYWSYGVPTGVVVAADTEEEARDLIDIKEGKRERTYMSTHRGFLKNRWLSAKYTKCKLLAEKSLFRVPKIILEGTSE